MLDQMRWLPGGELEIRGWAYLVGVAGQESGHPVLEFADRESGRVLRVDAESVPEPGANATSGDTVDHARSGFRVAIGPQQRAGLPARTDAQLQLDVRIEFTTAEGRYRSPFTERNWAGTEGALHPGAWDDSVIALPTWGGSSGFSLTLIAPAVLATGAELTDAGVQLDLQVIGDYSAAQVRMDGPPSPPAAAHVEKTAEGSHRIQITAGRSAASETERRAWSIVLVDREGNVEQVRWAAPTLGDALPLGDGSYLEFLEDGTVAVVHDPRILIVTSVDVQDGNPGALRVTGTLSDPQLAVRAIRLSGRRSQAPATEWEVTPEGRLDARIPLEHEPWGSRARPLPAGRYQLQIESGGGGPVEPLVVRSSQGPFGQREFGLVHNWHLSLKGGGVAIALSAPLAPDEIGVYNRKRLRAEAARSTDELAGTFFASWFGRNVSDSPLAIYRELSARGIGQPYTWEVVDLSVAVPDGCSAAVVGSRTWWRASTTSRHVVTNVWQRRDYLKREGQVVVQTWHGTPFKLLGLDRPAKSGNAASIRKIRRDTGKWDHVISQNPYSSEIFRRAYLWDRPILETGYPRNDLLAQADLRERARVRDALGLEADECAILYAPTWREDDRSSVGVLDLERLAEDLGPGYRLLLRGHSITLRSGTSVRSGAILDVSTYPDTADLLLAADLLVTDYSSIMFDFSVTGRPILFFVPDLKGYAGSTILGHRNRIRIRRDDVVRRTDATPKFRGVYFDLATRAPGPLLTKRRELVKAVHNIDVVTSQYASQYSAWRGGFNPHDDGEASRRVVDAVFGGQLGSRQR